MKRFFELKQRGRELTKLMITIGFFVSLASQAQDAVAQRNPVSAQGQEGADKDAPVGEDEVSGEESVGTAGPQTPADSEENRGTQQSDTPKADAAVDNKDDDVRANESVEPAKDVTKEEKSSWTDRVDFKGDLRYRFETIKKGKDDLRYRHRVRARPALVAKVFDDLDVTLGLGTGGAEGSDGDGDPVSNNQSLTGAFSSKWIWLDLAYFDYHPSWLPGIHLMGGKMKNPLYTVGKSELLWDPDLNPEGMSLSFQREFGPFEPFLHGVAYFLQERKADKDSWILGLQAGFKIHLLGGKFYILAGGRYIDYTHLKGMTLLWDGEDSFGNTTAEMLDDEGNPYSVYAEDYNVAGAFAEVGGKLFHLPWAVFGDWAINTATGKENTGWLVGASLGKAKKQWDFQLRYIYRQVQADAVFGLLSDSDFAGGDTDGKGHEWNAAIALHERVQLAFSYFYNKTPIEGSAGNPVIDYHRTQTDIQIKF